jgi:transketolase
VADGNDIQAVDRAIQEAKAVTDKPSLIAVNTVIGYGSPNVAGTSDAHGKALGADEVKLTKENLGWPTDEDFYIPGEALEHFRETVTRGQQQEADWESTFQAWRDAYPQLAEVWDDAWTGNLPANWDVDIPIFPTEKDVATRSASGKVLNAIAKHVPTMIGGDADLAGSTKTLIDDEEHTGAGKPGARNIRFGVREHAMGAIVNGLALHGGITKPFSATFLTFSDYMRPTIRLGSLMGIPTLYVFTHDSIGLGEDGPTHQPVEQVMSLRLIPDLHVLRPADAQETAAAWRTAMTLDKPAALIFTRQNLPVLEDADHIHEGVPHGGYVLKDCDGVPQVILLASGSEVHIAHEAYKTLMNEGIQTRLVSLPCWELFEQQDEVYQESVLPANVMARVSIEAGVTHGWEKFTGANGIRIGVDKFGASAPWQRIYEEYGLTSERVVEAAKRLL